MFTYLFVATFTDGSEIRQTQEDRSTLEPEGRTAFYDVLNSGKEIQEFSLVRASDGAVMITVVPATGIFKCEAIVVGKLDVHNADGPAEVVYSRRVQQSFDTNAADQIIAHTRTEILCYNIGLRIYRDGQELAHTLKLDH